MRLCPFKQGALRLAIVAGLLLAARPSTGAEGSSAAAFTAGHRATARPACSKRNRAAGTITIGDWRAFPTTLSPFQSTSPSAQVVENALFDDLFRVDNKGHLFPMMAAQIPTVKNGGIRSGGKVIIVRIKHGMRWSNGAEITAGDVRFGWEVERDPAVAACVTTCDHISRITVVDRYSVALHFSHVDASAILRDMPLPLPRTWPGLWKDNAHVAAQQLGRNPSVTFDSARFPTDGPYQVARVAPNDGIVLRPMRYYTTMTCGAMVRNLIVRFYPSTPALIAAAVSHQVDVTQGYGAADLPDLRRDAHTYALRLDPSLLLEHVEFNLDARYAGHLNPLHDLSVRRALALALDRPALIQAATGVGRASARGAAQWTFLIHTPGSIQPFVDRAIAGQWDPITRRYDADAGRGRALTDARALLRRTRWARGFSLDLVTTSGNPVRQAEAQAVAQSWSRIGVKVVPAYVPGAQLFGDWDHLGILHHGNFQVALFAFQLNLDPQGEHQLLASRYIDRRQSVHSLFNQNYAGVDDRVIDRSFAAGKSTFASRARARAYAAAQQRVNQLAYWIPLFAQPIITTKDGRIRGFSSSLDDGFAWNIYAWRVRS